MIKTKVSRFNCAELFDVSRKMFLNSEKARSTSDTIHDFS